MTTRILGQINVTIDMMCFVQVSGTVSSPFESRWRWTLLFNIALEGEIRKAGMKMSGIIFRKSLKDIRLRAEARRIRLAINASETKYMRTRGSRDDNVDLLRRVPIGDDENEVVEQFVNVGSLVTADNDTSRKKNRLRIYYD